jgi:Zn-dependent protease
MEVLLYLPVLLLSVVAHEFAHAWVALRQGDDTAYKLGRVTLNPLPHIDLVGSVLFPMLLWMTQAGFLFGWARPVPVDPRKYRSYRRGDILVSLAGISANLLLALAFTIATVLLIWLGRHIPALAASAALMTRMSGYGVEINLLLAFFNLIPIPPLDGSHVVYHLLPPRLGARYREMGRYGMLVLLAILFFAPGILSFFLWPVSELQRLARAFIGMWI